MNNIVAFARMITYPTLIAAPVVLKHKTHKVDRTKMLSRYLDDDIVVSSVTASQWHDKEDDVNPSEIISSCNTISLACTTNCFLQ